MSGVRWGLSVSSVPALVLLNVLIVGIVRALLRPWVPFEQPEIELPVEAVVVLVASAAERSWALRHVRGHIQMLHRIVKLDIAEARRALLLWVLSQLEDARKRLYELRGEAGWTLDVRTYNNLMKSLAQVKGTRVGRRKTAPYIATTADLPTVFFDRYPWVLESTDKTTFAKGMASRTIIAAPEDLRKDKSSNPAVYARFTDWHAAKGVALYGLAPEKLQLLDEAYSRDFGQYLTRWGRYAIVLRPTEDESTGDLVTVTARLYVARDEDFRRLKAYMAELENQRELLSQYLDSEATATSRSANMTATPWGWRRVLRRQGRRA